VPGGMSATWWLVFFLKLFGKVEFWDVLRFEIGGPC
jgi:hypothetical protein